MAYPRLWITVVAFAAPLLSSSSVAAQQIPIRPLGSVVATSSTDFGNPTQLLVLSDGRVLINDAQRHQVMAMSAGLVVPTVLIDSTPGLPNSYDAVAPGYAMNPIVPYRGDTVLFYDLPAHAILVLDSRGRIGRVMAPPFEGTSIMNGWPVNLAYSPALGFVYTAHRRATCPGVPQATPPVPTVPVVACDESLFVNTANVATRKIDTVLSIGSGVTLTIQGVQSVGSIALFPFFDGFTVTQDGAVAVLRAREYRLEWINPDGTHTQSPRIPFEWHPISDAERSHIIDSINAVRTSDVEKRLAQWIKDSTAVGGRGPTQNVGTRTSGALAGIPIVIPLPRPRPPSTIAATEVPDFLPPTSSPSAPIADAENHVWIRLKPTTPGGTADPLVYDVVDRQGKLIDRVRVPAGRAILGFSPGFAYLTWHDGGVIRIEKARIR